MDMVGRKLCGRYVLEELIAQGGASVVYAGLDELSERRVAVRIFLEDDARFEAAAATISRLSHPSTLRLQDFGRLADDPSHNFHVCEWVEGESLHSYVHYAGPLSRVEALAVLEPVAQAVGEAHACGLVHGSLEPSHVLIAGAGSTRAIKVGGFGGCARVGSIDWGAPEQLRKGAIGPGADVFSLGLLCAFMRTGRRVFSGDRMLALSQRMEGEVHVQRSLTSLGLHESEEAVLQRACRAEPHTRYVGVDDLVEGWKQAIGLVEDEDAHTTTPFGRKRAPGLTEAPSLTLEDLLEPEVLVAGRRLRLYNAEGRLDLGDDAGARVRVTLLPDPRRARLHVKGLNCFVAKGAGRPSAAVDVDGDTELSLVAPDRRVMDTVRLGFGVADVRGRHYALASARLSIPTGAADSAVLLDFGPGRDLVLVHQGAKRSPR